MSLGVHTHYKLIRELKISMVASVGESMLAWQWTHPHGHCGLAGGSCMASMGLQDGYRVTTCLENLEMSGNLTAVREMSGILLKVRENMSGKSCLKLFTVSCIFVSIHVFSRSLLCVKY